MANSKNRLGFETSPYLLQHAQNPVNWFPWGQEAFVEAADRDVPIILSIGYSSCHWCHVMETESFEDQGIASIMNQEFVSIKVDREDRPDIDSVYMNAVQAMSGHGGWPLTVFLTPDGSPFFGGTYYPPVGRGGIPGFPDVLRAVADGYRNRQSEIQSSADHVINHVRASLRDTTDEEIGFDLLHKAYKKLEESFDNVWGGFGNPVKFPQPLALGWLLRYSEINPSSQALNMLEKTLLRMANGGIYDHVGGGFHRYSTDKQWLVPHFEKMLYDNALVPHVYLQTYLKTGKKHYLKIALDAMEFVLTYLTSEDGLFYSSLDADSEGEEGLFYTWSIDEIEETLGEKEGKKIVELMGMTHKGNFEGTNILHSRDQARESPFLGDINARAFYEYPAFRHKLLKLRDKRPKPERDDKVIVSWNALMAVTLAECYLITRVEEYKNKAIQNIKRILEIKQTFGYLFRSYRDAKCSGQGFLEDYSALISACIKLHQATLDLDWLRRACELAEEMIELFWDKDKNEFYDSSGEDEFLLVRPRDIYDGVMPSPSSLALENLYVLSIITDNKKYKDMVICEVSKIAGIASENPLSFGKWLSLIDCLVAGTLEIAIVANNETEASEFINILYEGYIPNFVFAGNCKYKELDDEFNGWNLSPLLNHRALDDNSVAGFLCKDYACELPVHSLGQFREVIAAAKKDGLQSRIYS